jgi:hypothetical protein
MPEPQTMTALDVATMAQMIPLMQAAELIEQYARTMSAGARINATIVCRRGALLKLPKS